MPCHGMPCVYDVQLAGNSPMRPRHGRQHLACFEIHLLLQGRFHRRTRHGSGGTAEHKIPRASHYQSSTTKWWVVGWALCVSTACAPSSASHGGDVRHTHLAQSRFLNSYGTSARHAQKKKGSTRCHGAEGCHVKRSGALPCHAPRVLRSGSRPGGDLDGGLYRAGAG